MTNQTQLKKKIDISYTDTLQRSIIWHLSADNPYIYVCVCVCVCVCYEVHNE
jgi:cytochrome c oxidase assembly protein Cox11